MKKNLEVSINDSVEILESVLTTDSKEGIQILFEGPPGIGKSAIVEAACKKYNIPMITLIGSVLDPVDLSRITYGKYC
jgi:MoxR-like ATPase